MTDNNDNNRSNELLNEGNKDTEVEETKKEEEEELNDVGRNGDNAITSNVLNAFPINSNPIPNRFNNGMNDLDSLGIHSSIDPTDTPDLRPSVEWIYPTEYDGPRHELGSNNGETLVQNSENGENDENSENDFSIYMVDPNDVEIEYTVEGRVIPTRLCFLKICGFVVCDDAFPFLLNSKIFALIAILIIGVTTASILVKRNMAATDLDIITDFSPNDMMNKTTVTIDPRITNITQAILEVSGNITLVNNSFQNKALNWILFDDDLKLAHNSSNLLQRYALMVFFFNLSGESWVQNYGFGSGINECDWHGILCSKTIDGFKPITGLEMSINSLRGKLPNETVLLSRLRTINLSANAISGSIPSIIGTMKDLVNLNLEYNRLEGTIPAAITNCRKIERLYLDMNMISGSIPEFGRKQGNLNNLRLQYNKLTGTIPTSFATLPAIGTLLLDSNLLTGTIPTELANSNSLQSFNVENNYLTGEIPSKLANIPNLVKLWLSENMFSGTVPVALYKHGLIRDFRLYNNLLTGTIPSLSDFLPKAERIDLFGNAINGTIPEILGSLPNLRHLRLQDSMLSGTVPQRICDRKLMTLKVDCAGENPKVFCSCCPECF